MKHRWITALLIQIVEMLAVGALAALALGWGRVPHGIVLWGAAPLAALFSACRAVRRGLNSYAALIAPMPCLYASHYLLWGFSPSAGAALLAEFLALVGAAAGDALTKRGKR